MDPGASQEEKRRRGTQAKGSRSPDGCFISSWGALVCPVSPSASLHPCSQTALLSPLRSPHEHVWRLRRGGQRLWFSLEEPFVPQFSAIYPKCSLLPSPALPGPLPCDVVPCVF